VRRKCRVAGVFFACLLTAGSALAGPMFVKLGDIKGESKDPAHKDWIDLLAWQTGGERRENGRGCAAQQPGQLHITKLVDSTTPEILRMFSECEDFREVVLEAAISPDPASTEPGERVMRARFGGVLIIAVEAGSNSSDDVPTERLTLTYDKVEFEIVEVRRRE
jgi:type VI secretion system secreted protein Hcp